MKSARENLLLNLLKLIASYVNRWNLNYDYSLENVHI